MPDRSTPGQTRAVHGAGAPPRDVRSLQRRVGLLSNASLARRPNDLFCAGCQRYGRALMSAGCTVGRRTRSRCALHSWVLILSVEHVACGGSVVGVDEGGSDAGNESGNGVRDASGFNQLCLHNLDCIEEAGGPAASEGNDAALSTDASTGSDVGDLCGYETGPIAPGRAVHGPAMHCDPSFRCVNLDKGWACCSVEGGGGVSICLPFVTDGG